MTPPDPGVPTPRVLVGDDGAPLVDDRVLAVAVRWHDRPLTLLHACPGRPVTPAEGVALSWADGRPVASLDERHRAWVRGEDGAWRPAGRLFGLEVGELLVVEAGAVTVEARLQRRAASVAATERRHENVFFGLVVAHTVMLATAAVVALVITPRVDEAVSFFGAPQLLRVAAAQALLPPKPPTPELQAKIDQALARPPSAAAFSAPAPAATKRTAAQTVRLLLGGAGGGGVFGRGLSSGLDAALDALTAGPPVAGEGLAGLGARSLGAGLDAAGLGLGALGPGRGPRPESPEGSLRRHEVEVPLCHACRVTVTPGYHRDLVLKVVKRHQSEIRYCYEAALASAPQLGGKVTVGWTIGAAGQVDDAQVTESGLGHAGVEACIVQRVRRWRFPEPPDGQGVAITFPWVFQVAGEAAD